MGEDQEQLYVRVDGYKVLLQDLEAVRQIVNNINEATEVLKQVREVKMKTIDTVYENLDRMEDKLDDVAVEMPEFEEGQGDYSVTTPDETREIEIDESVEKLHSELESLQTELSGLGGDQ